MDRKFTLYHLCLYAKGWYKRENKKTIWEDLQVIMSLDDYSGEFMDKYDIVSVMLDHCQRLDVRGFKDLGLFANGIAPSQCWKYGYYTKDNASWVKDSKDLPDYDYYEAIVRYCLSTLVGTEIKAIVGEGKLPKPDYTKGLPRKNGISDKKLKELFA